MHYNTLEFGKVKVVKGKTGKWIREEPGDRCNPLTSYFGISLLSILFISAFKI
jgi:hypothetical protein